MSISDSTAERMLILLFVYLSMFIFSYKYIGQHLYWRHHRQC